MGSTRPHLSSRLEDRFHRLVAPILVRRGWVERVTASTGFGTPDAVRIFARVLLTPPPSGPHRLALRRLRFRRSARPARAPRGWRSLITVPATGAPVRIQIGGTAHSAVSDRGGYVHAQIITELEPGWHEAVLDVGAAPDLEPVACPVRIVDPNARIGVVCDIDDTVLITSVPRPLLATWNTFVLREHARRPVPGMGAFLHALAGDDGFVVYLSTGAWNFAPHLERFMAEHDLPPGPLFLTDWGPTSSGWFRSGAAHKRATLRQLRAEHPHTKWFLVGDDGQRDPEIYAEFAAAHPTAVAAVAIRHLTPTQQLLAQGVVPSHPEAPSGVDLGSVPWITGADGIELTQAYATIVTEDDREHSQ